MKKIALLMLLTNLGVFGQTIQKKDGATIDVSGGKIYVESANRRLTYFLKDNKKAQRVKFKDLDQAIWDGFRFKIYEMKGKPHGYYVIAEDGGKTLLLNKSTRTKNRGGFESTYTRYEMMVWDGGAATRHLAFTDEHSDKKIAERADIIPMIQTHFSSCGPLIEKVAAFESPPSDKKNSTILVLLNDPVYVKCQ